jgi:hypothetical protein
MIENVKPVDSLGVEGLWVFPVWKYAGCKGDDVFLGKP